MLCNNCGNQIPDNSVTCPNCGTPTNGGTQVPSGAPAAKTAFFQQTDAGINFIALIIAVVGLVCVFPAKVIAKSELLGINMGLPIIGKDAKYGIYMVVLLALTAVFLFLKKSHSALIPAAVNVVFCIAKMVQESSDAKSLGMGVSAGFNFFYWLVLILSILDVVAILVLPKVMGKNQ